MSGLQTVVNTLVNKSVLVPPFLTPLQTDSSASQLAFWTLYLILYNYKQTKVTNQKSSEQTTKQTVLYRKSKTIIRNNREGPVTS